jgi:methionyl-tRNA synthetase
MDRDRFYITTPIYYVNDKPHIGHAYTTILADVLAQYHRLLEVPTFFLTGTDEHGQKVQQAADKAGISPQKQADRTVVRFQELWEKLEITNDDFIRTTEERHKRVVQAILQDLYDRDEIYKAEYDGWYDVASETFVKEKDLDLPEGASPDDLPNITRITEQNYFFRMGKYRDWLIKHIETHPEFIQPDFRRNETLGFLRGELNDLCISRPKSRLAWGIELPFDSDFVCYVWFDALVNYISGVGYLSDDDKFAKWWPVDYHLIGKDILTTHTVYWPTMLKAVGLPMPRTIFAHGWWLTGKTKMSKSLGNVVNPMEMADKYGVDAFRYFLIAEMTLGQDASFTEDAFVRRYNADLANDLGNLLSRLLKMISKYCDGKIPTGPQAPNGDELLLWEHVQGAVARMAESVDSMALDSGLARVLASVRETNKYLEKKQPWTLAKQERGEELAVVLYTAAEALRVVSGLLYPVMPGKMGELRSGLGLAAGEPDVEQLKVWGELQAGTAVAESSALFPRVELRKEDVARSEQTPAPVAPAEEEPGVALIGFDEFSKLDLRTATVTLAERVAGTDKLMRLELDVGGRPRQIVAGIAQHYEADSLLGKMIVIVANLQPARIRGVESNGMLLAAKDGGKLCLIGVDGEIASGASVG